MSGPLEEDLSVAVAIAYVCGLVALVCIGMFHDALSPDAGPSPVVRDLIRLVERSQDRVASDRRSGSSVRIIALVVGVAGRLGMGYLILRHLDRSDGGIGQFGRMMDVLRRLESGE